MKININSWHARLTRWTYRIEELPGNLCGYFWIMLLAVILFPLTAIISLPRIFVGEYTKTESYPYLPFIICISIWFLLGILSFYLYGGYCVFFIGFNSKAILVNLAIVIFLVFTFMALIPFLFYIIRKKFSKTSISLTDTVVYQFIKAKKNKYCPVIEWTEDKTQ